MALEQDKFPNRKVFDCFLFNDEFDVLDIRLNELFNIVDKFIIVESAYTHTGLTKELHLKNNILKYNKFQSKIFLISDNNLPKRSNPIKLRKRQLNQINRGLKACLANPEDLVFFSDCDEIPRAEVITNLKENPQNCILELDGYISYYNLYFEKWRRGRAILYRDFVGILYLIRDYWIESNFYLRRFKWFPFMRLDPHFSASMFDSFTGAYVGFRKKQSLPIIVNAGWHFTKMFSSEKVLESINNSSHVNFNTEQISIDFIEEKKKEHRTFYGKDVKGNVVNLDSSFPQYLLNNKEKFQEFLL
jgi:beta-1,4-mannosyl-glycoprotein beta-1,4-N-acetylglucosaminyltransferase